MVHLGNWRSLLPNHWSEQELSVKTAREFRAWHHLRAFGTYSESWTFIKSLYVTECDWMFTTRPVMCCRHVSTALFPGSATEARRPRGWCRWGGGPALPNPKDCVAWNLLKFSFSKKNKHSISEMLSWLPCRETRGRHKTEVTDLDSWKHFETAALALMKAERREWVWKVLRKRTQQWFVGGWCVG